ncbi:MAG: glycosyltransferase [Kouleothrix sp.]|nr:glycosyltransferase [Kouleothrix sp.]
MRVLHVVEATIAGVRTHVQILVTGLDRRRFQPVVACPPHRERSFGDQQFVSYLAGADIPVVPIAMRRSISPAADIAALRRLVGLLRRERFDIIHLHSSKAGFLGRLAARIAGDAPTVYSPHGFAFLGRHGRGQRMLYLTLERLAGRLGDRLVAVSPGERAIAIRERIASPERVVCIENGIPPAMLPAAYDRLAQRAALGQPGDAPLIGTVARLTAQKNPRLFLDAAALLLRDLPGARFVWCGGGDLAEAARRYAAELGVAEACRFLGHRDDTPQIIAALDMFWLTSDYEGLPLAPLEAMSLGVPVVATDVVGTRDLLRGVAGLLVPPGDAGALASAARGLARSDERRARLGQAGRTSYLEHGTANRMIDAVERLYEDLAATHDRRVPVASAVA